MTQEGRSYEDTNVRARDPLDAIRDWYHLTGEELRRTEYDYYRYFRRKKLVHRYQNKNKVEHGKFFVMPEYTKEQEEADWHAFQESFLRFPDKKKRLLETITLCKNDLPRIQERIEKELKHLCSIESLRDLQAFILGGSVVTGLRDKEKDSTTDIDLFVVLKDATYNSGFPSDYQILDLAQSHTGIKYQIIFVGENPNYTPSFMPIHILSQPHIVLESAYDEASLALLKKKSIEYSTNSLPTLRANLLNLERDLEDKKAKTVVE